MPPDRTLRAGQLWVGQLSNMLKAAHELRPGGIDEDQLVPDPPVFLLNIFRGRLSLRFFKDQAGRAKSMPRNRWGLGTAGAKVTAAEPAPTLPEIVFAGFHTSSIFFAGT